MTKKTKTNEPKLRRVTIAMLNEYLEKEAERKEHARKARVLEAELARMKLSLTDLVEKNKGKPVTKGPHVVLFEEIQSRVSWKNEFVNHAGQEAADDLQANAPMTKRVTVK